MENFIYVICFYWQGDRWKENGMNYDNVEDDSFRRHLRRVGSVDKDLVSLYINNLYRGVTRNIDKPFKFICFTNEGGLNVLPGVNIRPFEMVTSKGVIPRMWMFSKAAGLMGYQVLCLDLDVVITGSLKDITDYKGLFCTRLGFAGRDKGQLDGDIMCFRACEETERLFWIPFVNNVREAERLTTGRERFWVRHVAGNVADTFDKLCPGQIISYKTHVRRGGVPRNARIVSCHGHPRPHQIKEKWIQENWK